MIIVIHVAGFSVHLGPDIVGKFACGNTSRHAVSSEDAAKAHEKVERGTVLIGYTVVVYCSPIGDTIALGSKIA